MAEKIFFERVAKRDAKLLTKWWNGHSTNSFEYRKRVDDKFFDVIKL